VEPDYGSRIPAKEAEMSTQFPEPATADDRTEPTARGLAIKRVKDKRDFTTHAVTYLVVNTFLILVWYLSGAGYFWPGWVLAGWGIGLVLNGWEVYGRKPISEADIEREMRQSR
jgi:hypothetical protein